MPQSLYEVLWIFIIYAFLGWCLEVAFCGLNDGHFTNRGFLNGPWCPIYGFGMLLLIFFLYPLRENLPLLFFGSMLFTSLLEFLTGFVLEKAFYSRWWDYSDMPFNICGYICLKFSIYWGLAGTFVIDILHEFIYKVLLMIPHIIGMILLAVLLVLFVLDCWLTVRTILKFSRKLRAMDDLAKGLRHISDDLGENIFESVETVADIAADASLVFRENLQETKSELVVKRQEQEARREGRMQEVRSDKRKQEQEQKQLQIRERLNTWKEENKKEWDSLFTKYIEAFSERKFGEERLLKAFPNLKLLNVQEMLDKYKNELFKRKDMDSDAEENAEKE